MRFHTNLTVAIASELRDEAHVILSNLNHLLTDVVLRAAGYRCAGPPRIEERGEEDVLLLTIKTLRGRKNTQEGAGYNLNATCTWYHTCLLYTHNTC